MWEGEATNRRAGWVSQVEKKAEKQVQAKFCRDRRRNQEYIRSIEGGGGGSKSMNTEEYIAECQISSVAL